MATRVRRGTTLEGRENSIGEEDEVEVGEEERELEEEVKEDEKSGKGVDISKQASSRNISKSCSPPRFPNSSFSSVNIFV